MNNIRNLLVKTDHFCDYVPPLVHSITNLVDLFQKCVVLPFIDKATISSNHFYKHINEKSFVRCFLLVILGIGSIIVGIYVFSKKKHNDDAVEDLKGKPVKDLKGKPVEDLKGKPVEDLKGKPVEDLKGKPVEDLKGKPVEDLKGEPVKDLKGEPEEDLKGKQGKIDEVEVRNRAHGRPQDDSLEKISKMTKESMNELCKSLKVNDRNDYIKCMLIVAIKAEKFDKGFVEGTFHDMVPYFQGDNGELKEFVHEDIAAGRNNQENTLLHEILKCEFLSAKAKGSAFGFILRDGHYYLRDYFGNRTLEEKNQWGIRPTTFSVVKWGDSLKKIFDTFPAEQQKEFFANSCDIADRLNSFTGIVKP